MRRDFNMETNSNLPAIINAEQVQQILVPIPKILEQGQTSLLKATGATQALLDTIEAEGMSQELDAEAMTLIQKLNITKKNLNEKRKPITQIIQSITKLFTGLESDIDTLTEKVQKHRDDYARAVAEEKRKAQQAIEKQMAKDREAAAIEADVKIKLNEYMLDYRVKEEQKLLNLFETATLENIDETAKKIILFPSEYPLKHFNAFKYSPAAVHHLPAEVDLIVKKSLSGYAAFAIEFKKRIDDVKSEFADRIPSKRIELEAIKQAENDEAERTRLEEIARRRKEKEQARIKSDAAIQAEASTSAARAAEAGQVTQSLFDAQNQIDQTPEQTGQVRTGYDIHVTRPAGYMQIANFYFEKEGLTITDMEKLGRKTLAQMKAFCESYAIKTGEFIESPYLVYNETFKAVNR